MRHRILLMARELDLGGSERQMTEMALALDRARFEPEVAAFHAEGMRGDELRAAGVPILRLPVRSFKSPRTLSYGWRLARYIRAQRIRLVHTFDLPLTAAAIPLTRFFTPAMALASQRSHLGLASPRLRKALTFAERIAHGVVVNCEFLRRHLVEDAGIPGERIHVCRNGIDLARFRRGPRDPGLRPAALESASLVIGVVCALRPEKGISTLLEAFARVRPLGPKVRLAVVGSGPVLPELEARARELGIREACHFEPSTERVPEWLRSIDIFVLPSVSEALSNSLMEAMACGCCAVASRAGGNPELIEDGTSGLLFKAGDAEGLARALGELMANPELRGRLADAGHDFLHANFSTAAAAQRMAGIYSQLIAEARP
jgi:glycosyltransferase involved in cell wall biosynthesis